MKQNRKVLDSGVEYSLEVLSSGVPWLHVRDERGRVLINESPAPECFQPRTDRPLLALYTMTELDIMTMAINFYRASVIEAGRELGDQELPGVSGTLGDAARRIDYEAGELLDRIRAARSVARRYVAPITEGAE